MKAISSKVNADFLRANSEAYEWLVEKIQSMDLDSRTNKEAVLQKIISAARFAVVFHPGRFADGAIENVALKIGAELDDVVAEDGRFVPPSVCKQSQRRILHIATDVLGIGGHTRMIYHWVREDRSARHSVLLLNQPDMTPVPWWLSDAVESSGGELMVLPALSDQCQKAKWLRETARQTADLVVLHHCPFDVVPTVAFAVQECPPVAVLNHADHLFWLGSSVTDIVINLRTTGSEHSAEHRFVTKNTVLPIPLTAPTEQLSRKDARQTLGIPEDQVVLLSIGRAEKYRPCGSHDFVATANKILDLHPNAHIYVVGGTVAEITPFLHHAMHGNLHFMGSMEDPSIYRMAADIYLESFPFGSQTALLEAALSGLPVVPAYAPLFPLLVANDDALTDILPNPKDEQEFIKRVELLICEPEQRVLFGEALQKRLLMDHVGKGWLQRLAVFYQEADRLTHNPRSIPRLPSMTTDMGINLSLWHAMVGKPHSPAISNDGIKAVLFHKAFVAKTVGNYAAARRYVWSAVQHDPFVWAVWRLLGIAMMGKMSLFLRRLFSRA